MWLKDHLRARIIQAPYFRHKLILKNKRFSQIEINSNDQIKRSNFVRIGSKFNLRIHPGNPQKCPTRSPSWCEYFFSIKFWVLVSSIDFWYNGKFFCGGGVLKKLSYYHFFPNWRNFVRVLKAFPRETGPKIPKYAPPTKFYFIF